MPDILVFGKVEESVYASSGIQQATTDTMSWMSCVEKSSCTTWNLGVFSLHCLTEGRFLSSQYKTGLPLAKKNLVSQSKFLFGYLPSGSDRIEAPHVPSWEHDFGISPLCLPA